MSDLQENTPQSRLKSRVALLFAKYVTIETTDAIETIADYYSYLAEHISYERYAVDVPHSLLEPFEAVSLILMERLQAYPEAIKRQVDGVFKDAKLLRTFGLLLSLGTGEMRRLRSYAGIARYFNAISRFMNLSVTLPSHLRVTQELLLEARLGLNRIAQILRYAATLEVASYEQVFQDVRNHYDPDLVNKHKLVALVNLLHVEINNFEDHSVQRLMLSKLHAIEEELRRPKPKWGTVITWAFVLFSFAADLKSVAPAAYDRTYKILGSMISVLHTEGSVNAAKTPSIPVGNTSEAAIVQATEIPLRRDEDEDEDEDSSK